MEEGGVKGRQAAGEGEEVGEQEDEGEAQSEERGWKRKNMQAHPLYVLYKQEEIGKEVINKQ